MKTCILVLLVAVTFSANAQPRSEAALCAVHVDAVLTASFNLAQGGSVDQKQEKNRKILITGLIVFSVIASLAVASKVFVIKHM